MGNPYYEPTIMIHGKVDVYQATLIEQSLTTQMESLMKETPHVSSFLELYFLYLDIQGNNH